MKKILLSLMFVTSSVWAAHITHTDYVGGNTITASGQNSNENAIVNEMNGNLDSTNLAANAVVTNTITDASVTQAKLSTVLQSSITAMAFQTAPNTFTSTNTFSVPGSSATFSGVTDINGQLNFAGAVGTAGQVLLSGGTSHPTFGSALGVGSWVLLTTATASSSTSIDFTGLQGSKYSEFQLIFDDLKAGTNAVNIKARISTGSGFLSTNYSDSEWKFVETGSGSGDGTGASTDSGWAISSRADTVGTGTGVIQSGEWHLYGANNTSARKRATWSCHGLFVNGHYETVMGGGEVDTNSAAIDGMSIVMSNGVIAQGNFYLYGLKAQ